MAAHEYLVKYLASFGESEPLSDTAVEQAKCAVVEAVRLVETVENEQLLGLPAIKHLQKTDPLLFRLLELFSQATLEDFHQFHKENPDFLHSVGNGPSHHQLLWTPVPFLTRPLL